MIGYMSIVLSWSELPMNCMLGCSLGPQTNYCGPRREAEGYS